MFTNVYCGLRPQLQRISELVDELLNQTSATRSELKQFIERQLLFHICSFLGFLLSKEKLKDRARTVPLCRLRYY